MYNYDNSNPMVINCTFSGNSAGLMGGGMCNDNRSNPMVVNCIFNGNSAGYGGGVYNIALSNPTVTDCTFSGNSADLMGGGMSNYGSSPTLINCILWGNIAPEPNGPQIAHLTNAALSISYSDLQGGQAAICDPCGTLVWGAGNIDADPLFIDSDGPDNIVGTPDDNLRLSSSSPCIDAGNNTAVPPDTSDLDGDGNITERTPFDLEGNNRFVDDPGTPDSGYGAPPVVDMGAYEYQIASYLLTVSSNSGGSVTTPGEGTFEYEYGEVVSIVAEADEHYQFVEWTGTAVDAGKVANPIAQSTTVTMTSDYTLAANFAEAGYLLAVSSNSGGSVTTPGEGIFEYEYGEVVSIVAEADEHYQFVEWTGTAVDAGKVANPVAESTTVTMTSDYTLAANFAEAGVVIYVDIDASGANNGTSWENAYNYLQDALINVTGGVEIRVAAGTYYPDESTANPEGTNNRSDTFELINGVAIKGGYAGWGEPDPGVRNIKVYKTILSGDIGMPDLDTDNSYHVVTGSGTDPNAILDGFTITGGNANGGGYMDNIGGGMINSSGRPTVNNCIFSRNSSSQTGGGMYNGLYSSSSVTNCIFINNSADSSGGGIYNDQCSTTVVNCIFSGNTADAHFGGGMCNGMANPSVINCTFSNNSSRVGGGIYCNNCSLTLINCILWGNTASIGPQIYDLGTIPATVSYCDVQGGWTGVGNINADPLFKDADGLDDITGTEDDNLKLSKGSPCIDAGYNPAIPLNVSLDLAGNSRFFDDAETIDTGYGGPPNVDMGAYEYFGQLVAHWKLDDIGGNIAYDSSGNGHHGSLYGDPNWQPDGGKTAGALEFNGIDDYVLENGGLNLNGLDGLTIALWIRSDVTGTDRGFIHFEDPCGHDNRGMRYDAFGATGGGVNLIKIGVTSDSPIGPPGWPGRQQLESSSNVQTTDWQHLSMTWSSGEQLKLYINGVLDTPTANEPALSGVLFGYNMVLIGRGGKYGQPETDAMGWDGLIDDVRIYNYALSGDEIRRLLCEKPPRGDVNGDCRFDFVDFAILFSEWMDCGMMNPELCGQ
jgi:predicted outer membrane repeat protein